jgi:peptidyl-prolyl cis-trans isomerase B (cyclophilin B)
MRAFIWALAFLAIGCSSPDAGTPTDSSTTASTPVAQSTTGTTASTPTDGKTSAGTSGGVSASALDRGSSTPQASSTSGSSGPSAADLVNADGKIDPGLPKTAGVGAKLPKDGDPIVIMNTSEGRIVAKFFPQKAPNHVKNFLTLAGKKFYDGTKFHRVIPGFMIQGGDPNTKSDDTSKWGQGGPGYTVKAEFNDIPHTRGILSMARTSDPDGAGSQFFIMHARYPSLDNQYSVFGQVIEGMDVVDKIVNTPTEDQNRPIKPMVLKTVEVTKWPIKLNG